MIVEGTKNLLVLDTNYYKDLFGPAPGNMFSISVNLWNENERISFYDNIDLTKPFSVEEIKHALFSMKLNKALVLIIFLLNFFNIVGILFGLILCICLSIFTVVC